VAFDGDSPFNFDVEIDCFEKAGAGDKARRIAGYVSTADLDKDGEVLIQKGLNFSQFLRNGYFNYNHGQGPDDLIGYPEDARYVRKGEMLPSGNVAHQDGWYVEGYLLKGVKKADDTWQLAQSLKGTGRRLGYSVEGKVLRRGMLKSGIPAVVEAMVRNVAVTHCPKNDKTALEILAKSLSVGSATATTPEAGAAVPGSGLALVPESHPTLGEKKKKKKRKKLSKGEAIEMVLQRFPNLSTVDAARVVDMAMKSRAA
jgi:hypothetical protein